MAGKIVIVKVALTKDHAYNDGKINAMMRIGSMALSWAHGLVWKMLLEKYILPLSFSLRRRGFLSKAQYITLRQFQTDIHLEIV